MLPSIEEESLTSLEAHGVFDQKRCPRENNAWAETNKLEESHKLIVILVCAHIWSYIETYDLVMWRKHLVGGSLTVGIKMVKQPNWMLKQEIFDGNKRVRTR